MEAIGSSQKRKNHGKDALCAPLKSFVPKARQGGGDAGVQSGIQGYVREYHIPRTLTCLNGAQSLRPSVRPSVSLALSTAPRAASSLS
eukprot:1158695-Pelagomonas_calceolata.AAC.1